MITSIVSKITKLFLSGIALFSVGFVAHAQSGPIVTCKTPESCNLNALFQTLSNVMDRLLQLATAMAVILFAWAGMLYLFSGVEPAKRKQAHNIIVATVVGFLIALSAWLIIEVLVNTLDVEPDFSPLGKSTARIQK